MLRLYQLVVRGSWSVTATPAATEEPDSAFQRLTAERTVVIDGPLQVTHSISVLEQSQARSSEHGKEYHVTDSGGAGGASDTALRVRLHLRHRQQAAGGNLPEQRQASRG